MISDGFIDKTWEALIVLATTAAICTGIVNLANFNSVRIASIALNEVEQADDLISPGLTSGYEALRFF
jgi:hypothetical protein